MKILARTSRWLIAMMAILVAALLAFGPRIAQSFWDESMAVHIKADEIESSTLAIGTHLIHLSALTDSIYEIADKSAEESGQTQIYYKSELGGDTWFDITSASSLEDITTGGAPVTDEEIEALFFTYHTKSDQITYDLRTGEAVNIFDIRDPYDLESMEELSPLKMQYDQIKEFEGDTDVTARIDEIWELPVTGEDAPEEITKYEEQLAALQAYKNVLSENDAEAREIEKVGSVMEAVDAARRYEVFSVVRVALEEYLDELGTGSSGGDSSEEEEVAPEDMDPELMSAVAESLSNVEDALITYGGMMLSEGITVISSAEYEFSNNLINHAVAGNHAACDGDVEDLLLLSNIQNGIVSDRPQELKLLESKLIPNATSEYLALLRKGESAEYRAAVVKNSAQALLNRFINENEGDVETRRGELEFMIQAKCDRIGTQDAMDFVDQRLTLTTETFSAGIPKDAFAETSQGSVDAHIIFLTDLRRTLELALGGNALDQLIAEKEDLQTQYMEKLDNNDLAGAKKLQEQLESLEEEIRSMEQETTAQITSLQDKINSLEEGTPERTAAEAELAALESGLSDGTLGATVAQLKRTALDGIQSGSGTGTGTGEGSGSGSGTAAAVDALAGMLSTAPKLVLPALQEVYNALLLNGGDQGLIDAIEQAVLENPNALQDELDAGEIREAAREWLLEQSGNTDQNDKRPLSGAGGISRLNAYNTMAAIVGLNLYCEETGNQAAQQVMASLAQEQTNLGNALVYNRIDDSSGEYVSLSALQALTGRRYVWNKNASQGVLALGSDYYAFTLYSTGVQRDRDGVKTEKMSRITKYQNGVHIPEEYAYEEFGTQAVYLENTTLGCICDDKAMEMAQDFLAYLLTL